MLNPTQNLLGNSKSQLQAMVTDYSLLEKGALKAADINNFNSSIHSLIHKKDQWLFYQRKVLRTACRGSKDNPHQVSHLRNPSASPKTTRQVFHMKSSPWPLKSFHLKKALSIGGI